MFLTSGLLAFNLGYLELSWSIMASSWPPLPLPGPSARSAVGGSLMLVPPSGAQNARDIRHFPHLGAILLHLVAHLAHLELSYAHLSPT